MGVREEGGGWERGSLRRQGAPEGATESHEWITKEPRRGMESEGRHRATETHGEARRATEKHAEPHRATAGQREPQRDMERHGETAEPRRGTGDPRSVTESQREPQSDM